MPDSSVRDQHAGLFADHAADALRDVMTLWAPLSPATLFDGVVEVEPGQVEHIECEVARFQRLIVAADAVLSEQCAGRINALAEGRRLRRWRRRLAGPGPPHRGLRALRRFTGEPLRDVWVALPDSGTFTSSDANGSDGIANRLMVS